MAKNSTTQGRAPADARQAKIQAAQKSRGGGGANKIVVASVVLIVAIIAVVAGVIISETSRKSAVVGNGKSLPAGVSAMGAGYPAFSEVTAAAGAPTLDLYEDFQCPACKSFEDRLGSTVEDLARAGKLTLVYHVKNFLDDNLRNDWSTKAGNAAFCAADAGKFQAFHDQVYANQPAEEGAGFTDDQLKGFAQASGVTGNALQTWSDCYSGEKYVAYIKAVEEKSFADGVRGTPTAKLAGTDLDLQTVSTPDALTQAVQAAAK